jgi:hypothetical protein
MDLRAYDRRIEEMAQAWRKRAGGGANERLNRLDDLTTAGRRGGFRRQGRKLLISKHHDGGLTT